MCIENVLFSGSKRRRVEATLDGISASLYAQSKWESVDKKYPDNFIKHRPHPDSILPIQLMSPLFAKISDFPHDPCDCPTEVAKEVWTFLDKSCDKFENELQRCEFVRRSFGNIFGIEFKPEKVQSSETDLSCTICDTFIVVEIKNEVGSGSGDPFLQILAYASKKFEGQNNHRYCALGILIAGPNIGFVGCVITPHWKVAEWLVPWMPLNAGLSEPCRTQAFRCIVNLRVVIDKPEIYFSTSVLLDRLKCVDQPYEFDSHTKFIEWVDDNDSKPQHRAHLVYSGTRDDTRVVVKFTRRHESLDVHHFAAHELDAAPSILDVSIINSQWTQVVMELVTPIDSADKSDAEYMEQLSILRQKVEKLHESGFVHGDLRPPNVVLFTDKKQTPMLLDFDWAGKDGSVLYPSYFNLEIDWADGVRPEAQIRKEHDLNMLGKFEQMLRERLEQRKATQQQQQ